LSLQEEQFLLFTIFVRRSV